jgi:hypothetical protein
MSVTALAEVESPPDRDGSLLRLYVPGIDPTPRLGRDPCSFSGCVLRVTRLEPVGPRTIYWAGTCDGHRLNDEPEC